MLTSDWNSKKHNYGRVSAYVNSIWQQDWDTSPIRRHFQQICPTVTATWRPKFHSRTTEVLAHRLRLGRYRLNAHLHQMEQSISENCNFCCQPETIEHYTMACPRNGVAAELRKSCDEHNIPHSLPAIFNNAAVFSKIKQLANKRL